MIKLCRKIKDKCRWLKGRNWYLRSFFLTNKYKNKANDFIRRNQENSVFILGTGRSGTQLVSNLLRATGKVQVFHEPNFYEDVSVMPKHRKNQELTKIYWQQFRKYQIYERWRYSQDGTMYSEVNGTIRYQIPGIINELPDAKLLLLVRDGRGFVRSLMGWKQFYSSDSKDAYALSPLPGDPYYECWHDMSRFERICWL